MLNTETKQSTPTALESATATPVNLLNGCHLYLCCLWLQENEPSESDEYQRHEETFIALVESISDPLEA